MKILNKIWSEFKDSLSFFWCKRIDGYVYTPYMMKQRTLFLGPIRIVLPGAIHKVDMNIEFEL